MTSDNNSKEGWVSKGFQNFESQLNGEKSAPLHTLRKAALESFANLGFPIAGTEEWKYTNISFLAKENFIVPNIKQTVSVADERIKKALINEDFDRVVFVDGLYSKELSRFTESGKVKIGSIKELQKSAEQTELKDKINGQFAKNASINNNNFAALNTAFLNDGAYLYLPKNEVLAKPLQFIFLSSEKLSDALITPRVVIVAEEGAEAKIIETYLSNSANKYLTNSVVEVSLGENAHVDHYKISMESDSATHIYGLHVRQAARSNFRTHFFTFGGALVRNEAHYLIDGEHCNSTLNGLTVLSGLQHVDNFTVLDHAMPNCESIERFKGIYSDKSKGVFTGTIIVRQDAQKTNAIQSNQSVLLSNDASIETRPQLKIWADDVKCTHGATVGQLDEEALFYIRQRGIDKTAARNILVHAFASDIITEVKVPELKTYLEDSLMQKLSEMRVA